MGKTTDEVINQIAESFNKHRKSVKPNARTVKFDAATVKKVKAWLKDYTVEDFEAVHAYTARQIRLGKYNVEWFNPETLYKKGQVGYSFGTRVNLAHEDSSVFAAPADDLYPTL